MTFLPPPPFSFWRCYVVGTFCSHSLSTVHFWLFLLLAPSLLFWMLHFYHQGQLKFFLISWGLVVVSDWSWHLEKGSYLLANCARYIILTPCLYSQSSQAIGNTAF